MRKPKDREKPINTARIAQWVARFPGYRQEITSQRITNWIHQFAPGDRDIAARILDCIEYVTHESIEAAFQTILGKLAGWDYNDTKRTGRWRFVAFSQAAGESGDTMLHKWRTSTGMTGAKYRKLYIHRSELLKENLGPEDTVVFVDDFAGTGNQVCTGWREIMEELLPGGPNIYLIFVAVTAQAVSRIGTETPMKVLSQIRLKDDDNVFSTHCKHFTNAEKQKLLSYCRRANSHHPKGWGDCGLVIVLAHKTPNNSIPVLHATRNNWQGIFPRQ